MRGRRRRRRWGQEPQLLHLKALKRDLKVWKVKKDEKEALGGEKRDLDRIYVDFLSSVPV